MHKTLLIAGSILIILLPLFIACESTPASDTGPRGLDIRPIDDADPSITWGGKWEVQENPGASGGTLTAAPPEGSAATFDASITLNFTGTVTSIRHIAAPYCGRMSVCIDGVDYPPIDMYSAEPEMKTTVIAHDLENKEHILVLSHINEKNSASTNYVVGIDVIEVTRPY